jgi:hypothetical protein
MSNEFSCRAVGALALAAGLAAASPAFAQTHRAQSTLHGVGRRLEPIRVAGFRWAGPGRIEFTTDWIPYTRPGTRVDTTPYFDCAEFDISSGQANPVGFCSGSCATNCGPSDTPDERWWSGETYVGPFVVNDMTVVSGASNAHASRVIVAANWGPVVATDLQLLVSTAETFNDTGTPPPFSGEYAGVIADFGPQASGPTGGYFILDVDVSTTPTLFYQMPSDGSGSYNMVLGNAVDPTTGAVTLETSPSTQFMYWGTGDAETPADGRVGHQGPFEWDDDSPTDGQFTANEFYNEGGLGICPDPVGPMAAFYGPAITGSTCYANCDQSTAVPFLNVQDFSCFLTKYASGDLYANCDNSTQQPVLNVSDFSCFLTKYATGCSAP